MTDPNALPLPKFAGFYDPEAAAAWRRHHGGWVFVGDNGVCTWFDLSHTPTTVLMHPALNGQTGNMPL